MFFKMKNRMAMYEISIKIVFRKCMFYNMVLSRKLVVSSW